MSGDGWMAGRPNGPSSVPNRRLEYFRWLGKVHLFCLRGRIVSQHASMALNAYLEHWWERKE